jgi:hypothetical protein
MLASVKERYIAVLQQYSDWGVDQDPQQVKQAAKEIFESIPIEGIESADWLEAMFLSQPQTALLKDTHAIRSPLELDHAVEQPLAELYINDAEFCLLTTQGIYCSMSDKLTRTVYSKIAQIDEDSVLKSFAERAKDKPFGTFDLITTDQGRVSVLFEYGKAHRPILSFLTQVIKQEYSKRAI